MKIKQITYNFENLEEMITSIKAGKEVFKKREHSFWGIDIPHQKIKVDFDNQTISYIIFRSLYSKETVEKKFDEINFERFEIVENF